jgi:aryl-alcohol dehydrogenase-like predicted oxidoreductase
MSVPARRIGDLEVSAISFGCMSLSHAYGVRPEPADSGRILNRALDLGYTMLDSAALYGFGHNEELIREYIGHRRGEYVLASKCGLHGVDGKRVMTNDPFELKKSCEESLKRLGTDVIDLFYLHRYDKVTPIEESVGALADLVDEGKVRAVGLSETSAETILRAHAVHPIAAVQTEYSLWTREAEIAVIDACREIGAAFVAFSPLARGFLTGALRDVSTLGEKDLRRNMPRFYPENFARNVALLDDYVALADEAGCTPGQLALAWLLEQGEDIIPIPGTANLAHLEENFTAGEVSVDAAVLERAGAMINRHTVTGDRYNPTTLAEIDTEQFP